MNIIDVEDLTISFDGKRAVDEVSFALSKNEIVGLVGESGCGKSLTAYSILGMQTPGSNLNGKIIYNGTNLFSLSEEGKRKLRGSKIALIPQDPLSALNPVFTIGDQILEVLQAHTNLSYEESIKRIIRVLESVNMPNPKDRLSYYPHQFSGGMRQRVLIAMSLVTEPDVLVADEPVTALDVTVQLQILEIMKGLKNKGKAILLITHDLSQVAEICDRILVMYLGKIVESGTVKNVFKNPRHPYTIGLLQSLPDEKKERLSTIFGQPPSINSIPAGCAFHPRCPFVMDACKKEIPGFYSIDSSGEHKSRCFLEIYK